MSARLSPELRPGIRDVFVVLAVVLLAVGTAAMTWGGSRTGGTVTAVFSVDGVESEPEKGSVFWFELPVDQR